MEQPSKIGSRFLRISFGDEFDGIEERIVESEYVGSHKVSESKVRNWEYVRNALEKEAVLEGMYGRLRHWPIACGGRVVVRADLVPWVESVHLNSERYGVFSTSRFLVEPLEDEPRCPDKRETHGETFWTTTDTHERRTIKYGSAATDVLALRLPSRLIGTVKNDQLVGRTFIDKYCPRHDDNADCRRSEAGAADVAAKLDEGDVAEAISEAKAWLMTKPDNTDLETTIELVARGLERRDQPEFGISALSLVPPLLTLGHDRSAETILREMLRWAGTSPAIANASELHAALLALFSRGSVSVGDYDELWGDEITMASRQTSDVGARARMDWISKLYSPGSMSLAPCHLKTSFAPLRWRRPARVGALFNERGSSNRHMLDIWMCGR